jgi:putative transcriptional regulator
VPVENRVRQARESRGDLTQQGLANAVGVTRQTIIALEKGEYNPSLQLALLISQILDVPVGELFWLVD